MHDEIQQYYLKVLHLLISMLRLLTNI